MILVTGGAGFIGSHIVEQLLGAGHAVRVLDDLRAGEQRVHRHPDAELIVGDVADPDTVARALRGADAVCHQAAKVGLGVDLADIADYVRDNDLGTAVLLRAMAGAGFSGRLVLAGSMVVYGEGAYRCPEHGPVAAPPRDPGRLAAGHFEPQCPVCGGELEPSAVPESAPDRPAQRVRGDQGPPGAPVLRLRPGDPRPGDRAALPQRVRTADAPRHPLRRGGRAVRRRARRRPRAAGL